MIVRREWYKGEGFNRKKKKIHGILSAWIYSYIH